MGFLAKLRTSQPSTAITSFMRSTELVEIVKVNCLPSAFASREGAGSTTEEKSPPFDPSRVYAEAPTHLRDITRAPRDAVLAAPEALLDQHGAFLIANKRNHRAGCRCIPEVVIVHVEARRCPDAHLIILEISSLRSDEEFIPHVMANEQVERWGALRSI